MKILLQIALYCFAHFGYSQINTFYVRPNQTDTNLVLAQDSHLVVRNTSNNIDKLFLFLGGTNSYTKAYKTISNFAGNLGFDVINLAYENAVAAASLSNDTDSLAFDKYRQEICLGTNLSIAVFVDSVNSIYNRTVKLLQFLDLTYPSQNWNQYLNNGGNDLNWSKIAIGGHSQGSGHAVYFAKFNIVERVLMFSGPNDYSDHYAQPAKWLRTIGITNMNLHFSYLSLLDEIVPFSKQLDNLHGLGLYPLTDTAHVDILNTPFNSSHCLYTTQPPGLAILNHNSPMKFSSINNDVWEYMLTSTLSVNVLESKKSNKLSFFPNPTSARLNINLPENGNLNYSVFNSSGIELIEGMLNSNDNLVDISSFKSGLYFIKVGQEILKVIKK
jgi:hypothetical protein